MNIEIILSFLWCFKLASIHNCSLLIIGSCLIPHSAWSCANFIQVFLSFTICVKYKIFSRDGKLNLDEFRLICKALFRNEKGHIYPLSEERAHHIFQVFDKNGDGFIDKEEFTFCWNHWIKVVSENVCKIVIN